MGSHRATEGTERTTRGGSLTPLRILRLLLALVLLLAGGAVMAFGVMTVMYSDPVLTSVVVCAVGVLLLGAAVWLMRSRRQ